jgi:hypothetical protein
MVVSDYRPCVVSYCNEPNYIGVHLLIESCERWGWPMRLIQGEWRGFGHRLKRVLSLAYKLRQEGFTHLWHLDAYDCLMVGPASRFAEAVNHYNNPALLLAAEHCCWPEAAKQWENHPKNQESKRVSRWSYPHSQYVWDLSQPLPAGFIDCEDGDDDQFQCHKAWIEDTKGKVKVDNECRLVQSVAFCSPWHNFFELDHITPSGLLYNRLTTTKPLAAHGNGGRGTALNWIEPRHPHDGV